MGYGSHPPFISNMKFFKDMLSDGEYPSLSRWLAFICVPIVVLVPMLVWVIASIHSMSEGKMAEVPGSLIGFMSAAGTLVAGNYYLAKREETKVELKDGS